MPRPESRTAFRSLPIQTSLGTDAFGDVIGTQRQLNYGQFRAAALLCDEMMQNSRIKAVTETRVDNLQACPLTVKPSAEKRKARKAAEFFGGVDEAPGRWDEVFPAGVLGDLTQWGVFLNIAVAEIVWRYDRDLRMWMPRIIPWHPQFLRWDESKRRFVLMTADQGEVVLPDVSQQPHSDGRWIVWCPRGYHNAWLKGIARALFAKYVMLSWNENDWASYNESYGHPLRKAIVPPSTPPDEQDAFLEQVANFKANPAVVLEQGEEGNRWDVGLVESSGKTDTFERSKAALDVDIAVLMLGQNLTTEAGTAGAGATLGSSKTHRKVEIQRTRTDAGIDAVLRDQVLWWWALYNLGDPELAPRPEHQVDPPEDEAQESATLLALGNGIQAMQIAAVPIDVRAIVEKAGFPLMSEEEIEAEEAAAAVGAEKVDLTPSAQGVIITVNEARRSIGLGPLMTTGGAEDPDGFISVTEYQAKHATVVAEAANAEAGSDGSEPEPEPMDPFAMNPDRGGGGQGLSPPDSAALRVRLSASTPGATAKLYVPGLVVKRYTFAGLPISVENPAGSFRLWRNEAAGRIGATKMQHDYGFIEGYRGGDDEELDVYIGPNPEPAEVYVVHQLRAPAFRVHDEDKLFLGFSSADEAKAAFLAHRNDTGAFGGMSTIPIDRFRAQLARRKPESTGKIRARAVGGVTAALVRLAERAEQPTAAALRASRSRAGAARAKRYPDRLTERSVQVAARALGPDVAHLRSEIEAASSFEDLEERLVRAYRGMDSAKLARVIERTRIMARLAGRLTVKKEAG